LQLMGSPTTRVRMVRRTGLPALRVAAIQARVAAVHHDDGSGAALRAQLRAFRKMRL
jgi:hypothetical protein